MSLLHLSCFLLPSFVLDKVYSYQQASNVMQQGDTTVTGK